MNHLFSAVQFFQVLTLILGGIFCIALPFAPQLRATIAQNFLTKDPLLFCLGLILLAVGLILGVGFYLLQRHRSIQVTMNPPVSIQSDVVAAVVQTYLQKRFPSQEMKTEAIIDPSGTLELITELPTVDLEKHLPAIEAEIGHLLHQNFHYNKQFKITFSY